MAILQLDFFKTEQECEIDDLRKSVDAIKMSSDKVRRGTYASINEIRRECYDLKSRLEIIEKNLCRGNYEP